MLKCVVPQEKEINTYVCSTDKISLTLPVYQYRLFSSAPDKKDNLSMFSVFLQKLQVDIVISHLKHLSDMFLERGHNISQSYPQKLTFFFFLGRAA